MNDFAAPSPKVLIEALTIYDSTSDPSSPSITINHDKTFEPTRLTFDWTISTTKLVMDSDQNMSSESEILADPEKITIVSSHMPTTKPEPSSETSLSFTHRLASSHI